MEIELSVVMPCLNEEEAVAICIKKIKALFEKERISGEIIVADNGSTDRSREIAASLGAKVVTEPKRGYGAAYLRGLGEASGRYIIIGDSDDSYDFREIPKLLTLLRNGCDFVMGSRFKGGIHSGAMSWSHRYIGNPILSFLCRLFFRTRLSDIHCGMRGFTLCAFRKMELKALGMEFATEMVVSALKNNLTIKEVGIVYYPRIGRSKLDSFSDAWRHVRFMLLFCPLWLYLVPGAAGFVISMLFLFLLLKGPFLFLGHPWNIHFMVIASVISIFSYQILGLGIFAHIFAVKQNFINRDRYTDFIEQRFNLEKGLLMGSVIFLVGFTVELFIFIEWFSTHFGPLERIRESIFAMTFLVIGLQTIFSSFFASLLFLEKK